LVQAVGKIPIDLQNYDSASISAHKIGGPRGIGLLYLKKAVEPLYSGGGQEGKIRPGTENVAGADAFAKCLEQFVPKNIIQTHYTQAQKRFEKLLTELRKIERCKLIPESRSPNDETFSPYIVQLGFKDIPGEVMVRLLDDLGFAVSTGSACSAATPDRPVLTAMGLDEKTSRQGIRISQGYSTNDDDIDKLISAIKGALQYL